MDNKYYINNIALKLVKYLNFDNNFIVLCLGSKKIKNDSLGCIVGSLLKYKYNIPVYCYGDLNNNITASNLRNIIKLISLKHNNKKILIVDSVAGEGFDVGNIKVFYGGVTPRSFIENCFYTMGDVSIVGVVYNKKDKLADFLKINYCDIKNLAVIIAGAISESIKLSKLFKTI